MSTPNGLRKATLARALLAVLSLLVLACSSALLARLATPVTAGAPRTLTAGTEAAASEAAPGASGVSDKPVKLPELGKLPLAFVSNEGQAAPGVRFVAHSSQAALLFSPSELTFILSSDGNRNASRAGDQQSPGGSYDSRARSPLLEEAVPAKPISVGRAWSGSSSSVRIEPGEPLGGKVNYLRGSDPEIKLYDDSRTLVATTLLSLPNTPGWNEPGEALKLRASEYASADALKGILAHELTHYIIFDMAGTAHSRMPWWLDEGLASYVGSRFDPPERAADRRSQVREWAAEEGLADWDSISDFETTPLELWEYVYPQGYAMVRYITERFGSERRNRWVAAMATDMEIEQATSEILGLPFEELDGAFEAWAKEQ